MEEVRHQGRRAWYAPAPEDWERVATAARQAGSVGLDSEFTGLDITTESPVGRAKVHVWSLGIRKPGGKTTYGITLPAAASQYEALRGVLEDAGIRKYAHNSPVDIHAFRNLGVNVRGCSNTLSVARWVLPDRVGGPGYSLKSLMPLLGMTPLGEFSELFGECPLDEIVPGHSAWERLVVYAAEDAVAALDLNDYLMAKNLERKLPNPWTSEQ